MKPEHEQILRQIADTVPSGGNIGLNNAHDLPNTVDWLVPLFVEFGSVHMDEARQYLVANGQAEKVADQVAYVIDVVGLALDSARRNGLLV